MAGPTPRSFARVRDEWNNWGERDPLWAIVSVPEHRGNRWDEAAFFRTGVERVDGLFARLRDSDLPVRDGTALDFGCGVGRLTQALARHFPSVVGVDVSPAMIRSARERNREPERVRFEVNPYPDLRAFGAGTFSFVFADIVLQHLPPPIALGYVGEFLRVVAPDGLVCFQLPSGPASPWLGWIPAAVLDPAYNWSRRGLRAVHLASPGWDTHWVARAGVMGAVNAAGGNLLRILAEPPIHGRLVNQTYAAAPRTMSSAPTGHPITGTG